MATQYENELKDHEEKVEPITNPLDEAVNEKRYTSPNVD